MSGCKKHKKELFADKGGALIVLNTSRIIFRVSNEKSLNNSNVDKNDK